MTAIIRKIINHYVRRRRDRVRRRRWRRSSLSSSSFSRWRHRGSGSVAVDQLPPLNPTSTAQDFKSFVCYLRRPTARALYLFPSDAMVMVLLLLRPVVTADGACFGVVDAVSSNRSSERRPVAAAPADDLLSHFRQVFEFKLEYYSYVYPTYRASHMNLGWRGTHHFPPNRTRHTEYVNQVDKYNNHEHEEVRSERHAITMPP